MTEPIVPDHIRAAIHAGHVALVVLFCDGCGFKHRGDFIGATKQDRFAAARAWLADNHGWEISDGQDLDPFCAAGIRWCPEDDHTHGRCCTGFTVPGEGYAVHPDDVPRYEELVARYYPRTPPDRRNEPLER